MKKLIAAIAVSLVVSLTASAQDSTKRSHKFHDRIKSEMNLSESQKKQIESIKSEYSNKMDDVKKDQSLSQEQRKVKFEELRKERHEAVDKVLTTEQKEKRKELKHHKHGTARRDGKDLKKELNLTREQEESLRQANETFRSRMQEIRTDKALSESEKKQRYQELKKEKKESFNKLLTSEQQEKLRQMRKRNKEVK